VKEDLNMDVNNISPKVFAYNLDKTGVTCNFTVVS
jgi:hypothetical protein